MKNKKKNINKIKEEKYRTEEQQELLRFIKILIIVVVFILAIIGATPLPKKLVERIGYKHWGRRILNVIEPIVMIFLLLLCTGYLVDGSFNPFLYFRF